MLGAIIGGAAALGSAFLSKKGQSDANEKNLQIAREQMAFQERMSGTSYQRAVKDMELAGINPMLAIGQGGASTPGGASAQMQSTLGPAVSSAIAARRMTAEVKAIAASTAKTQAETGLISTQANIAQRASGVADIAKPPIAIAGELSRGLFTRKNMQIMQYEIGSSARSISEGIARLRERLMSGLRRFGAPGIGPNTTPRRR